MRGIEICEAELFDIDWCYYNGGGFRRWQQFLVSN